VKVRGPTLLQDPCFAILSYLEEVLVAAGVLACFVPRAQWATPRWVSESRYHGPVHLPMLLFEKLELGGVTESPDYIDDPEWRCSNNWSHISP
jgi:hypothetical protein